MSAIPEDGVTLKEESEAADEADPDKRNPPQLKDKQIEPDNEFEDAPGKSGNRDNETSPAAAAPAKGDTVESVKKESSAASVSATSAAKDDTEEPMEVDDADVKPENDKSAAAKEGGNAASSIAAATS